MSLVYDCISHLIHVAFLTHMYHTHPVVAMVIVCICISLAIIFFYDFYIHFCPTFFFVFGKIFDTCTEGDTGRENEIIVE